MLDSKYKKQVNKDFDLVAIPGCSNLWKGIAESWPIAKEGLQWRAENDLQVRFWLDSWLSNEPLINHALCFIDNGDLHRSVHSFLIGDHWDFEVLDTLLPKNILMKLQAVCLRLNEASLDNFSWNGSLDGCFSVNSV